MWTCFVDTGASRTRARRLDDSPMPHGNGLLVLLSYVSELLFMKPPDSLWEVVTVKGLWWGRL